MCFRTLVPFVDEPRSAEKPPAKRKRREKDDEDIDIEGFDTDEDETEDKLPLVSTLSLS